MREDPVKEGLRRAEERRTQLTDEERRKSDDIKASVPDLIRRTFCSEANEHGRQKFYTATEQEFQEWKEVNK